MANVYFSGEIKAIHINEAKYAPFKKLVIFPEELTNEERPFTIK